MAAVHSIKEHEFDATLNPDFPLASAPSLVP
jgi:hypothetical protein